MTPATQTPSTPAHAVNGGATITPPRPSGQAVTARPASSDRPFVRYIWAATRLCLGWTFLWPFMDKAFGLGHETASADAWFSGGNPTQGFLSHSAGPFSGIYQDIAGAGVVNVLFMGLMWSASLPPENNLFMDDHIIYALVLIGLAAVGAGKTLGLGERWAQTEVVQKHSWLA
jgi:thiosulfate dehydrogenase (quinone) large subunit